jgi:hypothetical protein
MRDLVERLTYTADAGIPDYTNAALLKEAAAEIERLQGNIKQLQDQIDAMLAAAMKN